MDFEVILLPDIRLQPRRVHLQQNFLPVPLHRHLILRSHIGHVADGAALALLAAIAQGNRLRTYADAAFALGGKMQRSRQPIAINIDKILAEGGREQVGVAHKARHKARRGLAVKILRRADLHDMTFIHHQHGIGNRKGFALIVGHVQRGDIKLFLQFADLIAHAAPEVGVEVTQRLIK